MLDVESFMLGMAAGGGNPNSVETITGTLANPLPNGGWLALKNEIISGNATVNGILSMGATNGAFSIVPTGGEPVDLYGVGSEIKEDLASSIAFTFGWDNNGILNNAMVLQDGSVVSLLDMAAYIGTTLTIIHHPLP